MCTLCLLIANVLNDMVGQHNIKGLIGKRQLSVLDLMVAITFDDQAIVVDVHRIHFTTQLGVRTKIVRNTTRASANLKHAYRLRAIGKIQQALNFQAFEAARWQVEHSVRLAQSWRTINITLNACLIFRWSVSHMIHPASCASAHRRQATSYRRQTHGKQ